MTREDAVRKIIGSGHMVALAHRATLGTVSFEHTPSSPPPQDDFAFKLVNALEALGLLKLDPS